jgi:ribonuclease G
MKELFIDRGITQNRVAVYEDEKLTALYIENFDFADMNGNIYKGRIENIVYGLNAAFVNIGVYKNAILHFENSDELLRYKKGQDILVQVTREGIGDKGPRVSTEISIPSKYAVLLPGEDYIGVSQKVEDINTRRIIKLNIGEVYDSNYGVIIRTEGAKVSKEELQNDYLGLVNKWKDIERKSQFLKAPQLIFNSKDFYELILRDYLKNDLDKIHINRKKDVDYFKSKLTRVDKSLEKKLVYDEFNFMLQDRIEKEIQKLLEKKVMLKSGGYIVIDYTEAFTCIDVNSGNFTGDINQNTESTLLSVNIGAAKTISNEIKLRNITGIILVDFIDMKNEESREEVLKIFESEFANDKSKLRVYGFTKLGILEMTRTKKGHRISEFVYSNLEELTINYSYYLKLIENKSIRMKKLYKKNVLKVYMSKKLYEDTQNMLPIFTSEMMEAYGVELIFTKSEQLDKNTFNIDFI